MHLIFHKIFKILECKLIRRSINLVNNWMSMINKDNIIILFGEIKQWKLKILMNKQKIK